MRKRSIMILLAACLLQSVAAQRLSLKECEQMALENNKTLQNARLEVQAAGSDKSSALTNYFPQISATGLGFLSAKDLVRGDMEIPGMGSLPLSMINDGVTGALTALQPVFMGGQIVNGNALAALQEEVRELQMGMSEKDLLQSVRNYYWNLVSIKGNLTTLDAAREQLDEVHRQVSGYVQAGVVNRNDLLRVELKQQEIQSQRLTLENGINLTRMLLAQLVGADMEAFDIAYESDADSVQKPEAYFISSSEALEAREESQLLEKSVQAQKLQVKMEVGKNLPTVAVGGTAFYNKILGKGQTNLVGMATVSIPISSWWGGSHQIKKARIKLRESENERDDTREKLTIDILHSWNSLQEGYEQVQIALKGVEQADENLRICRDEYTAGVKDMTVLLDAVTLFTQSHNALESAKAQYQSRIADYMRKTR